MSVPIADEQFADLLSLLRQQVEQNARAQELYRKETLETRQIQRDLVVAIQGLHRELEFWRSRPARDAELNELEDRVMSRIDQLQTAIGG